MNKSEVLTFLGNLPDNDVNLPNLADKMSRGSGIIPFVGAGLSVPYKFPNWDGFIRDAGRRAGVLKEVKAHLAALEYEEAAELLQTRLLGRFQDLMEYNFGDRVLQNAQFQGAVALIPHIAAGPVITTNFDRLLENVFASAGRPFPLSVWHDKVQAMIQSIAGNDLLLLKLHGDWQFPAERILTLQEYRRHYGISKTEIDFDLPIPHLLELLVTRPMLFLGCSLKQDRTGQIIAQLSARNPGFRHFAIVEYPENKAKYARRADELDRMNIRPIWYPHKEHAKIEQILAYLAEQIPADRRLIRKKAADPVRPDTIPRPLSSFIGRTREKRDLYDRISKNQLVTVAGAPGVGKTRLTIEVVRRLQASFAATWYVPLSQIPGIAAVPQRISHIMQLKGQTSRDLLDGIAAALKPGKQLLILDNCESVMEEVAGIVRRLRAECPELHIVVTSRIDLGNEVERGAEYLYRVPPLAFPDPDHLPGLEALSHIDSVELLLERAQAHSAVLQLSKTNARKVARLCRDLDGIPLALELVAAQLDMVSIDWVLTQWDKRETATLRNTIRMSYDLLVGEQNDQRLCTLFRRLAVFHRGWTAEAALEVCGDPGETENSVREMLRSLRRASLIEVEDSAGATRYRYLDAIREFAFGELARDGGEKEFMARHAAWTTALAERWAPELLTDRQTEALATLIADADNLRAAILWARDQQDAETALRLNGALWRLMEIKGFYSDGCKRLKSALEMAGSKNFPVLRSKALSGLSVLAYRQGDLKTARESSQESFELESAHGTSAGVANALNDLGNVEQLSGRYEEALRLYGKSLAIERERKNHRGIAVALYNCGRQDMNLGRLTEAVEMIKESLGLFETAGNRREASFALNTLGRLAHLQGHADLALDYAERSLTIRSELGDQRGVAEALRTKAAVWIDRGDFSTAPDLLARSGEIVFSIGDDRGLIETLEHLGWLNVAMAASIQSPILFAAAQEMRTRLGVPIPPVDQPAHEAHLNAARSALGAPSFAEKWEQGRAMPPHEAFLLGVNRKTMSHGSHHA